jgi:hypothetical protein
MDIQVRYQGDQGTRRHVHHPRCSAASTPLQAALRVKDAELEQRGSLLVKTKVGVDTLNIFCGSGLGLQVSLRRFPCRRQSSTCKMSWQAPATKWTSGAG